MNLRIFTYLSNNSYYQKIKLWTATQEISAIFSIKAKGVTRNFRKQNLQCNFDSLHWLPTTFLKIVVLNLIQLSIELFNIHYNNCM